MNISEETIDSFLRGDLSETEIAAFNKAVAADPKLQQEVSIQRDIIDAVKQNRHQQLKDRLNAIDVKPVGVGFFSTPYVKLAASIGVVALIVGSFSVFNSNKETISTVVASSATGTESTETSPIPSAENASSKTEKTSSATTIEQTENNVTAQSSKVVAANTSKSTKSSNAKNTASDATYEEPSEEPLDSDNAIQGINDNFNMPTMNHDGNTSSISSPQIKVSIVKENNLGYRFFNNQLFLHGNFSNSTYELFELNNKPSKQLFLYFENNYYELIQGKTKVTSLTPITDKAILLQLTQLREH